VLSLGAGSHFDELLNAHQKQTTTSVQFLQNRARLPDVLKIFALFGEDAERVPSVLVGSSTVESVQPSMRREKVRGILEFDSLTLLYAFLSHHVASLERPLLKANKRQRKNRYSASFEAALR
jgi:hypothetical protein